MSLLLQDGSSLLMQDGNNLLLQASDGAAEEVVEEQNSGGYSLWIKFEQEQLRREDERKRQAIAKKKALKIKKKIDRELALAERKLEEEVSRKAELARINRLVAANQDYILSLENAKIELAMVESLERQTFSTMERLERELTKVKEEEDFLLMATQIIMEAV